MSEWKEVKLGDVILHSCSGGTPKSNVSEYYDGEIPWLNTKEIDFNRIYQTERNITQKGLDNSSAKWIDEKCVIIAMYGATAGKIAINMIPLTTNQACCNLKVDDRLADFRYIYYFLKKDFKFLASLANGGAQQNLNSQIIKDYVIKLPSLSIQKEISDLLWTIDAKIETNNKLNEKLEEMAQAIFKSWFVDFEPFKDKPFHETELGMIPEGWEVKNIDHLYDIKYGNNLPTSEIKKSGQYPVYGANGVIGYHDVSNCNDYSVLITSRGNGSGDVYRTHSSKSYVTNNSFIVKPKSNYSWIELSYIYYSFLNINFKSYTNGSAQPQLTNKSIHNIDILLPTKKEIQNFCNLTMPIVYNIELLMRENDRLASLRDTLLPRLMSGELIV